MKTLARPAASLALLGVLAVALLAHEGHAPLPTRGAQVDVPKGQITLSKEARDALDLETALVQVRPVEEAVTAYATLVAPWQGHAFASSRLGGRIAKLHAKPGQSVKVGEVLAEVKSLELETLQLDLLSSRNESRLSARLVAVLEKSGGSVPEQEVRDAKGKHQQNLDALEVAKARWASLGLDAGDLEQLLSEGKPSLATLPVRSPIAGTVTHADLTVGRVVEPAEHLFEVMDVSRVWVRIGVLEKDVGRVAVGMPVELRLSAHPAESFRTTVAKVVPHLDPVTHEEAVWAELTNPSRGSPRLLPGMTGSARLLLKASDKGLAVPAEAVVHDGGETYVLVEEAAVEGGSQFVRRNVVPGGRSGGWVSLLPGDLYPGDRVVTRGSHQLGSFFVPGVLRPSPEAVRSMGLAVEPASRHEIGDVTEIDGAVDLSPSARATASPPLAGTLVKIHADRGQTVAAGDLLAEVQSLEFLNVQLDLLRAHLEGLLLEDAFARMKQAADSVARRRLIEVESQVLASRQSRTSLRRKLLLLGLSDGEVDRLLKEKAPVRALPVRAPVGGVVTSFDRVLGQAVKAEEPLFTIHDLSRPLFVGHLSERESALVRVGQSVRIRLPAAPDFLAEGKVARSGRVLGGDGRTLAVWVEPSRPPSRMLRLGQLARLSLVGPSSAAGLAVPHSAVVREGSRRFVFVKKADGSFERRAVQTGRSDDLHVAIIRGVQEGEPVAVRGADRLRTAFAVVR